MTKRKKKTTQPQTIELPTDREPFTLSPDENSSESSSSSSPKSLNANQSESECVSIDSSLQSAEICLVSLDLEDLDEARRVLLNVYQKKTIQMIRKLESIFCEKPNQVIGNIWANDLGFVVFGHEIY